MDKIEFVGISKEQYETLAHLARLSQIDAQAILALARTVNELVVRLNRTDRALAGAYLTDRDPGDEQSPTGTIEAWAVFEHGDRLLLATPSSALSDVLGLALGIGGIPGSTYKRRVRITIEELEP